MTVIKPALRGQNPQRISPRDGPASREIPENVIKPWKLPPQKTYILKNANVVDTLEGVVHSGMTVKLADGLIQSVGPSSSFSPSTHTEAEEEGIITVDLSGKYLCPGLIDCHVHLSAVPGEPTLAGAFNRGSPLSYLRQPFVCAQSLKRGFTSVRDCGGATLALKEAIADDVFPGPRLFIANQALSQTGGHGDRRSAHEPSSSWSSSACCGVDSGLSAICDGVPACIRAAREQLRTGADFIKIMVGGGVASPTDRIENTQFTGEELRAICEVARSYGTWVTAHAYTPAAIRHAVSNGVTGIEHGNLIDEDTARYMAKHGVWLTPTLVTYDALGSDKYAGFLPPVNQAKNQQVLVQGLQSLQLAARAGVTMCYGSDLLGPLTAEESREFGIRAQVLSGKMVLQAATVNAARMLRQEGFLGQVKEGFAADLLVLNGNPLDDVGMLDRPDESVLAVVKNGRVYCSRWQGVSEDVGERRVFIE